MKTLMLLAFGTTNGHRLRQDPSRATPWRSPRHLGSRQRGFSSRPAHRSLRPKVGGAPGEITRRCAPRPFGVALRAIKRPAAVCRTRLVVCREFELTPLVTGARKGFLGLSRLVRPERFELPTTWFEARCSIQLSYGRISRPVYRIRGPEFRVPRDASRACCALRVRQALNHSRRPPLQSIQQISKLHPRRSALAVPGTKVVISS